MSSNKELDEMIAKLEKMKDDNLPSDEKELKRLKSKDNKELSVDEKMRMDSLSRHVNQRKRDEEFTRKWRNVSNPRWLTDKDLGE